VEVVPSPWIPDIITWLSVTVFLTLSGLYHYDGNGQIVFSSCISMQLSLISQSYKDVCYKVRHYTLPQIQARGLFDR
jgi:hypothetical protein